MAGMFQPVTLVFQGEYSVLSTLRIRFSPRKWRHFENPEAPRPLLYRFKPFQGFLGQEIMATTVSFFHHRVARTKFDRNHKRRLPVDRGHPRYEAVVG